MKHVLTVLLIGVTVIMSLTLASYLVLTKFSPDREVRFMFEAVSALQQLEHNTSVSWMQDDERVNVKIYGWATQDAQTVEHEHEFQLIQLTDEGTYKNVLAVLRNVADTDYLFYQSPGPQINGVTIDGGSWIEFKQGELEQWGSILPGVHAPIDWITRGWWDQEQMVRLRNLIAITDIFHLEWNGITQIVDGENTRMMDATIDQTALEVWLLDAVRAKEQRSPTDEERILARQLASQISQLEVTLWIGTRDHLPYRIQAKGTWETQTGQQVELEVQTEMSFPSTQTVISSPDQTTSFQEIYQLAFGALPQAQGTQALTGTSGSVSDQVILPIQTIEQTNDSDGDGLDDILENFYRTDAQNQDTDGDGISDGNEVRAGTNPLGEGSLFGFGL